MEISARRQFIDIVIDDDNRPPDKIVGAPPDARHTASNVIDQSTSWLVIMTASLVPVLVCTRPC